MTRLASMRRVLRDHRRGTLIWAFAVAAISGFYLSFYPAMGDEMVQAIQGLPEGIYRGLGYDQIGTAAGYVNSLVYGLLAPLLLAVHGIVAGGRLIAGQEEAGALELDFAAPVSRTRLYAERLAALWLLVLALVTALTLTVLALNAPLGLDLAASGILAAGLLLVALIGGFATVAYAVGAASGRRGLGVAVASALAVVAYVLRAVADATGNEWAAAISPFAWMLGPEPIREGLDPVALAKLLAVPLAFAPLGLWRFLRRDLGT